MNPTSLKNANADENFATMKGFTITNYIYSGDKSIDARSIVYDDTTYGSMSLWVGQYKYYNVSSDMMYVTLLIEAKISSRGKIGDDQFNNQSMEIVVSHDSYLDTTIVCYDPVQTDSQYTVTQDVSLKAGLDDVNVGYSYQTTRTYNQINFTTCTYTDEAPLDSTVERLSKKFTYEFSNYSSDESNASPYRGEIIQRMSVTFGVDYDSNPGNYDTDGETFYVDFTGKIYGKLGGWFTKDKTATNTISIECTNRIGVVEN